MLPDARLLEITGAAHVPFLSHPDVFLIRLWNFCMDEFLIDKKQVRLAFSRAAQGYEATAVLQREVCQRMLERLDYFKMQPARVLDAGSGTGWGTRQLARRYPSATNSGIGYCIGHAECSTRAIRLVAQIVFG